MRMLIEFYGHDHCSDHAALSQSFETVSNELLLFAVRRNFTKCVVILLDSDVDVNCCDALGRTPLYLAAQFGHEPIVNLLLKHKSLIDIPETVKNWTPLIIACLEGFSTVVEVLLKDDANINHIDNSGWTAIDHASYRGHIPLTKALSKTSSHLSHRQATEIRRQFQTASKGRLPARGQPRRSTNTTESCIVVNLGSLDSSKTTPPVYLIPALIENPLLINPESMFSLGVSVVGTTSPQYFITLPLLEDATNIPWVFTHTDPASAKLVFEIFSNRLSSNGSRELVGRGMAFLESYKRSLHTKRESLSRDFTIPILSMASVDYIGSVIFSFVVSTPLVLPNTPAIDTEALWFENGPSKVVGHRGLGQNLLPKKRLQVRENTVQWMWGLLCRDVQLTKDYVPVVYHDFLVSETGIDTPMYKLTYEQFMHLDYDQSDQRRTALPWSGETSCFKTPLSRKVRTLSLTASDRDQTKVFMARVKHTLDYNSRGCKGNTKDDFIHESFVTFGGLLNSLPLNIGMDIEIKYPMLSEATDDWKMDPFFIEANFFTDTILLCLAEHISTRPVLLSSFSPEICILLALKQSRWPVFFGNDSGNWQPTEIRATNLQEGLNFAKKWHLDGLVLASEPLVLAPQLVGFVKEKGMVCATYGELNDEIDGVMIQAAAGVDILIVNNVRLVSEVLSGLESK
ncbi:uncharacterized protein RSE6_08306 [Rhynchosporium secalis]|uniref:GP-PDE domain-containing protein n=1 Tax=Rhynchosporium secalis TaxID=38038 RepID=A0A1E1MF38_RHYSE|nr:uncharacterized protein RSE6_08306 [Rhynchosporium secalis]